MSKNKYVYVRYDVGSGKSVEIIQPNTKCHSKTSMHS